MDQKKQNDSIMVKKKSSPSSLYKVQDTTLVAWLIENVQLLGLAALFLRIGPLWDFAQFNNNNDDATTYPTYLSLFFKCWFAFVVNDMLVSEVLAWNVHWLYHHIPFYNTQKKPEPINRLPDRLQNETIQMFVAAVFFAALPRIGFIPQSSTPTTASWLSNGWWGCLVHLLAARLSMDTIFHALHQGLLHNTGSWFYTQCHKQHHQHHYPRLDTNYYFHHLDRFLEGPTSVVLGLLMGTSITVQITGGGMPSVYEIAYCFVMLVHNLFASHCGKHIPSCSFFPPLAVLYRPLLLASTTTSTQQQQAQSSDHNIHHHFVHHEKSSCNFGINSWTDYVMKTRYQDVFPPAPKNQKQQQQQ